MILRVGGLFREAEKPGRDVGAIRGGELDAAIGRHAARVLIGAAMAIFDEVLDRRGVAAFDQGGGAQVHSHPGHALSFQPVALHADGFLKFGFSGCGVGRAVCLHGAQKRQPESREDAETLLEVHHESPLFWLAPCSLSGRL